MAQLPNAFDATQVEPADERTALPAGEYTAMLVNSEMKWTKQGTGQYLNLDFQVIDGPFQGRHFFDRLNLVNPNQQAVDIAQRQLSALCHAVNVLHVQDSAQLHDKPLIAKLKYVAAKDNFSEKNEVVAYKPAAGSTAPAPAPAPIPASTAARNPASGVKPAWAK